MTISTIARTLGGACLAAACLTGAAHAGALLGTGSLEKDADLTRVASAAGTLEFLDLTSTQGWTLEMALFSYAPQGFRLAGGAEMGELLGAFGIGYVVTADYLAELPSTPAGSAALVEHVGATWNEAAFGISYEAARSMIIFSCISRANCGEPTNYVAMEDNNFGNELMGFYLVRDGATAVPVPPTLPLTGAALLAMAALRRRRS
jgi:hypothetical protein